MYAGTGHWYGCGQTVGGWFSPSTMWLLGASIPGWGVLPAQDCIYIEKVPILSELSGSLLHMLKVAGVNVKSQEELGLHWWQRDSDRESATDDSGHGMNVRKITASYKKIYCPTDNRNKMRQKAFTFGYSCFCALLGERLIKGNFYLYF